MTSIVRRYLKTAILFLIVGLLLGAWAMVQRELGLTFPGTYLISAHTHAILVGFVMMMILGVAQWMFPRPAKTDTQYSANRAALAYWFITVGTATRVVGELLFERREPRGLGVAAGDPVQDHADGTDDDAGRGHGDYDFKDV